MNRQSVRTHFRRVGIVVSTMWSRGTGRFSLIVLGLWVLVSLVSLFWTPRIQLADRTVEHRIARVRDEFGVRLAHRAGVVRGQIGRAHV